MTVGDDQAQRLFATTCRQGGGPPDWLRLVIKAARERSTDEVAELEAAISAQIRAHLYRAEEWPESPVDQFRRTLYGVCARVGCQLPGTPPGDLRGSGDALRARLRDGWLLDAAETWAADWDRPNAWPEQPVVPSGALHSLRMTVLLVATDDANGEQFGVPAQLSLWLVTAPGAMLSLAAAPCSAVTPVDHDFQCGLDSVTTYLRETVTGQGTDDFAIAWDLCPAMEVSLPAVGGDSASASIALGSLWLLKDYLPDGNLRTAMHRIDAASLALHPVTASFRSCGTLDSVGLVRTKANVLQPLANALQRSLHVHVADGQSVAAALTVPEQLGVRIERHPDINSLALWLAHDALKLTSAQQALLDVLLRAEENADRPPAVDSATLAMVQREPVTTLAQYLLHRWASWALRGPQGDPHCHFVPLVVQPLQTGLPHTLRLDLSEHKSLPELLAANDNRGIHAYKLRGPSDAGKSTLLQHYERLICVRALRQLMAGHPVNEVPLFLPFNDLHRQLPGDGTLAPSLREVVRKRVQASYGECADLLDRLAERATGRRAIRLICDGIDGLPTDQTTDLLYALSHWCSGMPMLLSASSSFEVRFHRASQAPLQVVQVQVHPWDDHHIRAYLALRFPHATPSSDQHWRKLVRISRDLEICRLPGHLGRWCDLASEDYSRAACDWGAARVDELPRSAIQRWKYRVYRWTIAGLKRTVFRYMGYALLNDLGTVTRSRGFVVTALGLLVVCVLRAADIQAALDADSSSSAPVEIQLSGVLRDEDSQSPVLSGVIHVHRDRELGLKDVRVFVADVLSDGRATQWYEVSITSSAGDQRGSIGFATVVPSVPGTGFVTCLIGHQNGSSKHWKVVQRFLADQTIPVAKLTESGKRVVEVRSSEQTCS